MRLVFAGTPDTALPSLRALTLLADRLQVPMSELLGEVKEGLPRVYTPRHEDQHPPATARDG